MKNKTQYSLIWQNMVIMGAGFLTSEDTSDIFYINKVVINTRRDHHAVILSLTMQNFTYKLDQDLLGICYHEGKITSEKITSEK